MALGQPLKKGVDVEKLKRRAFTAEFKIEAVKLVTESGLSYAEVGRRLDVLPKRMARGQPLKHWEDMYRGGKLIAGAPRLRVTAAHRELSKRRKEVQDLKMKRDSLKKAPHGAPRPFCAETHRGYWRMLHAYTERAYRQ